MIGSFWVACAVCSAPGAVPDTLAPENAVPMEAAVDVKVGGLAVAGTMLIERRLELLVAVQPAPELTFTVGAPMLVRSFARDETGWSSVVAGDLSVTADIRAFDREKGLRHRLWLSPELKFPTGPVEYDPEGVPLVSNLQPGCDSILPRLSVLYLFGEGTWAVDLRGAVGVPYPVGTAPHRASNASIGADVVITPWRPITLRAGSWWWFEGTGMDADDNYEPNSAGTTGYASMALEARFEDRFRTSFSLDFPVVHHLRGEQEPFPIASLRFTGHWDVGAKEEPEGPIFAGLGSPGH